MIYFDRENLRNIELRELGCTGIYVDQSGDTYEIDRLTNECHRFQKSDTSFKSYY